MESSTTSGLLLVFLPIVIAVALLCFAALIINRTLSRYSRRLPLGGVMTISVIHLVLYVALFFAAFAFGDAQQPFPFFARATLSVLSAPLMYVLNLNLDPGVFGVLGRWWSDGLNLILGLAVLNALIWGTSIMWVITYFRAKRDV